jgi:glycosyltransferase involved in cell wall biosynthesis
MICRSWQQRRLPGSRRIARRCDAGGELPLFRQSAPSPLGAVYRGDVRAPLTAIVSSHNEARLLERCLPTLAFCEELLVIDIESDDDTAAVAMAHGARVFRHEWVPIAERARLELVDQAAHEWLLFMDPDETMPPPLASQLSQLVPRLEADVGVVDCPWQFYFRNRPLRGTVWGGISRKRTLARRGGAELRPTVHSGTRPLPGYRAEAVAYSGDNAIAHYWAPSWKALIEKHLRYLRLEGSDRRADGIVTGLRDIVGTPFPAFYQSFVRRSGYRDGLLGFGLSVLWAAYSTGAKISLLRALRRAENTVTGHE